MTRAATEYAAWQALSRYSPRPDQADVDVILAAADAYAAEMTPKVRVLRHPDDSGTDLYPVIGLLAELLEDGHAQVYARRRDRSRERNRSRFAPPDDPDDEMTGRRKDTDDEGTARSA